MGGVTALLWQYHLADERPILWQPPLAGKTSNAALVCYKDIFSATLCKLRMSIFRRTIFRRTGVWVNNT